MRRTGARRTEKTMDALEQGIRDAYRKLSVKPQDWIRLAKLRPLVNGGRREVDATLMDLLKRGDAHLAPDSNTKTLTEADHGAAIKVGSEWKHLLCFDED
jgi:hypothetical protein